jgi:hypothetical protein
VFIEGMGKNSEERLLLHVFIYFFSTGVLMPGFVLDRQAFYPLSNATGFLL